MAIIKLGGTVVGVRGTIGGVIYTANKSGPYARAWSKGSNPRTAPQQVSRGDFASLGPVWQGLSSAQVADWDALAATDPEPHTNSLGEAIVFSGWTLFTMFNKRRLVVGLDIAEDAPTGTEATRPSARAFVGFGVDVSTPQCVCSWDTTGAPSDEYCVLQVGIRPTPGVVFKRSFRSMGYNTADIVLGLDFTSIFESTFGFDVVGWSAYAWLWTQRESGIRSVVATDDTVIV